MKKILGYDILKNGDKIAKVKLKNNKYEAEFISLGATLSKLKIPNKKNEIIDVVLGFDNAQDYIDYPTHFGMVIGRYANRIRDGKFFLEEKKYEIETNDNGNTLHCGKSCICWNNWKTSLFENNGNPCVKFETQVFEKDDNWPGDVKFIVTYELTNKGEIILKYYATTTKDTFINLTNHSYFNLVGNSNSDILDYYFECEARKYLEVDKNLIPTGNILETEGTPLDFIKRSRIRDKIDINIGYDTCFIFDDFDKKLHHRATVSTSLLTMEVYTTLPAIQFYTSNNLTNTIIGKYGNNCIKFGGICLEAQYYPDSPNNNNFPSTLLKAGEEYNEMTIYKFI